MHMGTHLYNVCICLYVYVGINGYMQILFMYMCVGRSVISDSESRSKILFSHSASLVPSTDKVYHCTGW